MARKAAKSTATGHLREADEFWVPFEDIARDPAAWAFKADELRMAARLIALHVAERTRKLRGSESERLSVHTPSLMPQYLLLSAFSIENYLKALLIRKNPSLVTSGGLSGKIATHDLAALAVLGGISLTEARRSFLDLLSNAAVDFGRYPAPRSLERHMSHRAAKGDLVGEVERIAGDIRRRLKRGSDALALGRLPPWRAPIGMRAISTDWHWT
jgi:hypothetical protein